MSSKKELCAQNKCWLLSETNDPEQVYIPTMGDMGDVDPALYYNRGRAFKAISAANDLGIPAELFAIEYLKDNSQPIQIVSDRFTGRIIPVVVGEENTPLVFDAQINQLKKNGIVFDWYAFAAADKHGDVQLVQGLKESLRRFSQSLGEVNRRAVKFFHDLKELKSKIGSFGYGSASAPAFPSHKYGEKDLNFPILLGCYGKRPCFFVKISDWD